MAKRKVQKVSAAIDKDAWQILQDVKDEYELVTLSAAIRMLKKLTERNGNDK